jgi:hypothetical protein
MEITYTQIKVAKLFLIQYIYFYSHCLSTLYTLLIAMEFVGPKERLLAGTCILLVYCLGEFLLLLLGYIIRDWKYLQLALAVPMAVTLLYWWYVQLITLYKSCGRYSWNIHPFTLFLSIARFSTISFLHFFDLIFQA